MPKRHNIKLICPKKIENALDANTGDSEGFRNTILKITDYSYFLNNEVQIEDKGFDVKKNPNKRPVGSELSEKENYIDFESWLRPQTCDYSVIEQGFVIKYNYFVSFERYNHKDKVLPVNPHCDIETKLEYGGSCPLTCCVAKDGIDIVRSFQDGGYKQDIDGRHWHYKIPKKPNPEGLFVPQFTTFNEKLIKLSTYLRNKVPRFRKLGSNLVQTIARRVFVAYKNFWDKKLPAKYPVFHKKGESLDFKASDIQLMSRGTSKCERKSKKAKENASIPLNNSNYGYFKFKNAGLIDIPELKNLTVKFFDSWKEGWEGRKIKGATLLKKADGYYLSVIVSDLEDEYPEVVEQEEIKSAVGVDVGINKLATLSNNKKIENKRFKTNKRTTRKIKRLDRKISRASYAGKNYIKLRKAKNRLEKKISDRRNSYNWKVANIIVKSVDAVVFESLNILNMVKRAKKILKDNGKGYKKNGQCRKAGLNKAILDASWGDLKDKCEWLCKKRGKLFFEVNPRNTSRTCPECGHTHADNRDGEKFLCENCGYISDADEVGSRNIVRRAGFTWKQKRFKAEKNGQLIFCKTSRNEVVKVKRQKREKVEVRYEQLSLF